VSRAVGASLASTPAVGLSGYLLDKRSVVEHPSHVNEGDVLEELALEDFPKDVRGGRPTVALRLLRELLPLIAVTVSVRSVQLAKHVARGEGACSPTGRTVQRLGTAGSHALDDLAQDVVGIEDVNPDRPDRAPERLKRA